MSALTSSNGGPDDNAAQAGHLITQLTYRKAQKAHHPEDCERWQLDDTVDTLDAGGHTARTATVIAATLTSGGHPNSNAPGRRQEDDVNLIAFQPQAAGDSALSIDITAPCLNGSQQAAIHSDTTVRRLTPMECERLQGFPDGHTLTSNGRAQADSARYKQMGNAVAVPCVEWIVQRLVALDDDGAA